MDYSYCLKYFSPSKCFTDLSNTNAHEFENVSRIFKIYIQIKEPPSVRRTNGDFASLKYG